MLVAFSWGDEVTQDKSNSDAGVRGGIMGGMMKISLIGNYPVTLSYKSVLIYSSAGKSFICIKCA